MDILGLNNFNTKTLVEIIKLYKKKRVVIVGETCSGKDHLKNILLANGFEKSISYTTRKPRETEKDGIDYFFVEKSQFISYMRDKYFYEWDNFDGSSYGTTYTEWNAINPNKVFIMTPQSIKKMTQEDRKSSLVIYLQVNYDLQMQRLNERGVSEEVAKRRLDLDELIFDNFFNWDIRIKDLTIV